MTSTGSDSMRIPGPDRRAGGCSDVSRSRSIGLSSRMSWHIHPVHVRLTAVSPSPLFTFSLYRIGEDGRRLGEITVVRTIGDRRLMTSVAIVMLLLVSGIMLGVSDSEADTEVNFDYTYTGAGDKKFELPWGEGETEKSTLHVKLDITDESKKLDVYANGLASIEVPDGKTLYMDLNGCSVTSSFVSGSKAQFTDTFYVLGNLILYDSAGGGYI